METTLSQLPSLSKRVIFLGAAYDVLVTAAFATPWTAAWILHLLSYWHDKLGLAGSALPTVDPVSMIFVNFSGTIVLMWGGLRLFRPNLLNGAIDSAGRLAVALWIFLAIRAGASTISLPLMVGELIWFVLQVGVIVYALDKIKG